MWCILWLGKCVQSFPMNKNKKNVKFVCTECKVVTCFLYQRPISWQERLLLCIEKLPIPTIFKYFTHIDIKYYCYIHVTFSLYTYIKYTHIVYDDKFFFFIFFHVSKIWNEYISRPCQKNKEKLFNKTRDLDFSHVG